MPYAIEYIIVGVAILLLVSVLASKVSDWLGIPALLLFLVLGMLAGSEGPGGIHFDDPFIAQSMGIVALGFILFAGGLDTDWRQVRSVLSAGIALSTLGVLITALLTSLFVTAVFGFSLLEALLLGAVISSTDAAAVFSILRSKNVRLDDPLSPLLELESGSNDPMAVFLTTAFIALLISPAESFAGLIPMFVHQMAAGALVGYLLGKGTVFLINRIRLGYEGLYPVLSLALVLFVYGASASLGGNGFLAVYIAGLIIGNHDFIHKRSLKRFHDGLAWLMQIIMFLILGLLVFPSHLVPVIGSGLAISMFLMLLARPASVFLSLAFSRFSIREKTMVSWVGLRGAVPIILATFPLLSGVEEAEIIFNIVFFIVLTSALLQGTSVPLVSKWLRVASPVPQEPAPPLELQPTEKLEGKLSEMKLEKGSPAIGKRIIDLQLPEGALIVLIGRAGRFIVPGGGTVLMAGDRLLILADKSGLNKIRSAIT